MYTLSGYKAGDYFVCSAPLLSRQLSEDELGSCANPWFVFRESKKSESGLKLIKRCATRRAALKHALRKAKQKEGKQR